MRRTLIDKIPVPLPESIRKLVEGARIFDSSCSPEARVYFIDKKHGYYLKVSEVGTLSSEAKMTTYFNKKGLGAKVIEYISAECDFLLTSKVNGEDATHETFISKPERLCDFLAERLRELHETDFSDCPVKNRNESYLALADKNYKEARFDLSLTDELFRFKSKDEAYAVLSEGRSEFKSDCLLHGDYCLPNIILTNDFKFSGFIDLGNGGVGDRHIDIFWGTWTLFFNLKTDKYRSRFIDVYGRDKVNEQMLKIIAAAEVFG